MPLFVFTPDEQTIKFSPTEKSSADNDLLVALLLLTKLCAEMVTFPKAFLDLCLFVIVLQVSECPQQAALLSSFTILQALRVNISGFFFPSLKHQIFDAQSCRDADVLRGVQFIWIEYS